MIFGLGTDIVDVKHMQQKLERAGFKEKVFTAEEISYCEGKQKAAEHFAARFAAKEALAKAMGTGWYGQCEITDVSVANDEKGMPHFVFKQPVAELLREAGVTAWHISMSHTQNFAVATVILEKD